METLKRLQQEQWLYLAAGARLFHFSRLHPNESVHLRMLMERFSPKKGGFYADFGCGIGTVMEYLEQCYEASTVGINLSPEQAEICLEKGLTVRLGSYVSTGLPRETVDAVLCFETFGYADPEQTLRECRRILKPRGQIWLKDIFFLGTDAQRKEVFKVWRYFFYRPDEMVALFRRCGFELHFKLFPGHIEHYLQIMASMQTAGIQAFVECADAPIDAVYTGFSHMTGVAYLA